MSYVMISGHVMILVTWTLWAQACDDLDRDGCASLIAQNPSLCADEAFSQSACRKSCGNCRNTFL